MHTNRAGGSHVTVPRTQLGWGSQEGEVWLHLRHRSAPTALNPWQWREYWCLGPAAPITLLLHPSCHLSDEAVPGQAVLPLAVVGLCQSLAQLLETWDPQDPAQGRADFLALSEHHRLQERSGIVNFICLPSLAPAGPGSLQHGARPGAVHPSTHHSSFHLFLHCQTDPC